MQGTSIKDVTDRWLPGDAGARAGAAQTLGGWVLATWVGVAMVVLVPVVLVYVTPAPKSATWLFALVVTTISGARYAWIVADGRRRLYEFTFWVFTYVFLGVAPLVQLRSGQTPYTAPRIDTALQQAAMVVILVGIAAFVVGLSVSVPRRGVSRGAFVVNGVDLGRTVVLALFALALDAYFIATIGLGTLFSTRDELTAAVLSAWGGKWFAPLATPPTPAIIAGPLLVAFIALVKCIKQTRSREWPLFALTVFVGLALAITINPITNLRVVFGTAAMAIAALFGLFTTARLFRLTAILWVVVLIVVFPFADAFRRDPGGHLKSHSPLESLITPDFDALAQINNTLLYVERYGVTRGGQAAGVVLFWIPRRVWAGKPVDTTILVAESRGYGFQNMSAPLWAEMYINGGWPLLVLGMFGLGIVVRSQDNRIEKSLQRARAPGVLACILPFYLTILLRGSLLQAMAFLSMVVVSAIFVSRWERASS
jgi:hypothetical protein